MYLFTQTHTHTQYVFTTRTQQRCPAAFLPVLAGRYSIATYSFIYMHMCSFACSLRSNPIDLYHTVCVRIYVYIYMMTSYIDINLFICTYIHTNEYKSSHIENEYTYIRIHTYIHTNTHAFG